MNSLIRTIDWSRSSYSRCFKLPLESWQKVERYAYERGLRSMTDAIYAVAHLCSQPTYRARIKCGDLAGWDVPKKSVQWRGKKSEVAGLYEAKKDGCGKSLDMVLFLAIKALTGWEDIPMVYSQKVKK